MRWFIRSSTGRVMGYNEDTKRWGLIDQGSEVYEFWLAVGEPPNNVEVYSNAIMKLELIYTGDEKVRFADVDRRKLERL